jgi:hypothetical protein
MKRARWTVAGSALLLAVVLIPWLARTGNGGAAKAETPAPGAVVDALGATGPSGKAEAGPDRPRPARESERPGAKAAQGKAARAAADRSSLQIIGSLTAAHYFQTYLNIGFLADGKDRGTYAAKDARQLLLTVLSVLDSVDRQLETLGKQGLDRDDRDSLEQMRAISALLRQEGKELQDYWDSRRVEDADRYESLRKHSYAAITRLLGIAP